MWPFKCTGNQPLVASAVPGFRSTILSCSIDVDLNYHHIRTLFCCLKRPLNGPLERALEWASVGNHRWHDIRHLASVFKDGTAAICRSLWTSVFFFPSCLIVSNILYVSTWCSLQNWENDPQSCFLASFLGGGAFQPAKFSFRIVVHHLWEFLYLCLCSWTFRCQLYAGVGLTWWSARLSMHWWVGDNLEGLGCLLIIYCKGTAKLGAPRLL